MIIEDQALTAITKVDNQTHRAVQKYLAQYAENEIESLQDIPSFQYHHCVVIPAYQENSSYLQRLFNNNFCYSKKFTRLLAVIILNCPDDASPEAMDKTRHNLNYIHKYGTQLWQQEHLSLFNIDTCAQDRPLHVLVVNRIDKLIPAKQGVGLARKIGADIACYLYHHQKLNSPWIHSTDADARLPDDYFKIDEQIETTKNRQAAALVYPFTHRNNLKSAASHLTHLYHLLYECHLFHYQMGLLYAGSPFGFQTVGSAVAISAPHYAMVRGFPKRSAGEDFYLLNKLIKTSHLVSLIKPNITLDSRVSTRNPFGTGPAVNSLLLENKLLSSEIFYHPKLFILLKMFIGLFHYFSTDRNLDWKHIVEKHLASKDDKKLIIAAATSIHFERALVHAFQQFKGNDARSEAAIRRHLNTWFDGFRTLKWMHFLKDYRYNHTNIINAYSAEIYPVSRKELGLESLNSQPQDKIVDRMDQALMRWLSAIRLHLYAENKIHSIV